MINNQPDCKCKNCSFYPFFHYVSVKESIHNSVVIEQMLETHADGLKKGYAWDKTNNIKYVYDGVAWTVLK